MGCGPPAATALVIALGIARRHCTPYMHAFSARTGSELIHDDGWSRCEGVAVHDDRAGRSAAAYPLRRRHQQLPPATAGHALLDFVLATSADHPSRPKPCHHRSTRAELVTTMRPHVAATTFFADSAAAAARSQRRWLVAAAGLSIDLGLVLDLG
ncbi:Os07g0478316 [Oryza sativa Japonica Group]|uniref:Os07g0478316 protein n=2 Tax=Oryza sativa subsp. japonica TaxID=39947 RepID=A0A0P0X650_ORYSJ|nr:hypothetical protein OsJ_24229 [Oryza sativa Japonica Group]BAC75590.1 hypothetical protein [Oryza sativa Japonica Group]BAT01463.1 Os07g0478316 [Oryza sativa Japonica Group]